MYINFFAFYQKSHFLKNFVKIIVYNIFLYNIIITDEGGPIRWGGAARRGGPTRGGTQIDDKYKTRGDLIRTSLKSSSLHMYEL